jgi:hypothetical protein
LPPDTIADLRKLGEETGVSMQGLM